MASFDNYVTRNSVYDYKLGTTYGNSEPMSDLPYKVSVNKPLQPSFFRDSSFDKQSVNKFHDEKLMQKQEYQLNQSADITIREIDTVVEPNSGEPESVNFCCRILIIILTVTVIALVAGMVTFFVLYFGVYTKSPTYKESCSTSKPCATNTDLICETTCKCSSKKYWDGFKCANLLQFGSNCYGGTFQCQNGLNCINNLCQCLNTTYYSNDQCLPKLYFNSACSNCSYSTTCPNCISCSQCQNTFYCDPTSLICNCPSSDYFYDIFTKTCKTRSTFNSYCVSDNYCTQGSGLYCQSIQNGSTCPTMPLASYCNCPLGSYFNGTHCKTLETYYSKCIYNCSCDSTKLLYCDTAEYRCLCPTNLTWNPTTLTCSVQLTYNQACNISSQCLVSKGLICKNGFCTCGAWTGNWYWSSLLQQCIQCPSDWIFVSQSQRCIKVFYDLQTWTGSQQMCLLNSANLIQLNDANIFNTTKWLNVRKDVNYWVGGGDSRVDRTFRWTFDSSLVDGTITTWCGAQPDSTYNENCLAITLASACVFDQLCTVQYFYICQKIT